jgi:hypothetical protein
LIEDGFLSKKLFSKKGSIIDNAKFDKTLTEDPSRQAMHPIDVVPMGAVQCYNRANHMIMSLV